MWTRDRETIACALDDAGVLTITLSRPGRLNAFTVAMADELVDAFGAASADDAVRAIVVTGAGSAFCAGMDLATTAGPNVFGLDETLRPTRRDLDERFDDPAIARGLRDTGGRVTLAIFDCTKPVIAAVNGPAIGVGATMTLAMDVRLASPSARFGFVFGRLGIVPDACASWFLPRVVGLPKALQWTLAAAVVETPEALASGLVDAVVDADDLLAEAHRRARHFTTDRSPASVALIRQMMWRHAAVDHPMTAHKVESLALWHTSQGDGKEGVRAFLEKRPPRFAARASDLPESYPWW